MFKKMVRYVLHMRYFFIFTKNMMFSRTILYSIGFYGHFQKGNHLFKISKCEFPFIKEETHRN